MNFFQNLAVIFYIIATRMFHEAESYWTAPCMNNIDFTIKPENLLRALRDGNSEHEFPSLNVIKVKQYNVFEYDRVTRFKIEGLLQDLEMRGLFQYEDVSLLSDKNDLNHRYIKYTVPELTITGNEMLRWNYVFSDTNNTVGNFTITLRDVKVEMKVDINKVNIVLWAMDIVDIRELYIHVTGTYNNSPWEEKISKSIFFGESPMECIRKFYIGQNFFEYFSDPVFDALWRGNLTIFY